MNYKITIHSEDNKQTVKVKQGTNLLTLLLTENFFVNSFCGGKGICGKCLVEFISNPPSPTPGDIKLLNQEQLNKGYRLACRITISQAMEIRVISEKKIDTNFGIKNNFYKTKKNINPTLNKKFIDFKKNKTDKSSSYINLISSKINFNNITLKALNKMDEIINNNHSNCTVLFNQKTQNILNLESQNTVDDFWGLGIDIGTTTISCYLVNLNTGKTFDTFSINNTQQKYGADIISRINYAANNKEGKELLQQELIQQLNKAINYFIERNNISPQNIYQITIAANTALLHFLLGLSAGTLGRAPFRPLFCELMHLKANKLNLNINPSGLITLIPAISSYLGADITAGLLAVNLNTSENCNYLLIDIGTNGEIVLKKGKKYFSCSTAAGPAFEGTNISSGIPGIPGAISEFHLSSSGKISYQTIADKRPVGICGSGLLDITAALLEHNLITFRGKIRDKTKVPTVFNDLITNVNGEKAVKIIQNDKGKKEKLYITQKDLREIQMAKGAIRAGINILFNKTELKLNNLDNIFLAGGFGNFLNSINARKIGLIPDISLNKIKQVGNSSGRGARYLLLNHKHCQKLQDIKNNMKYFSLSQEPDFQKALIKTIDFPEKNKKTTTF